MDQRYDIQVGVSVRRGVAWAVGKCTFLFFRCGALFFRRSRKPTAWQIEEGERLKKEMGLNGKVSYSKSCSTNGIISYGFLVEF